MQTLNLNQTLSAWSALGELVFVPRSEEECDRLITLLDTLIDHVGEDEAHPLASMMDVIGVLIEKYEDEQVPELSVDSSA